MEMTIYFPGGKCVDAKYGDMVIKTDQEGSAPTPFALFLASMGTCAGIYVLSFCQKRGLPTENIRIHQRAEFDPDTHMVKQVNLEIELPPDFPAKYKNAVVKAAQLCAVKRHLENPPKFNVTARIA